MLELTSERREQDRVLLSATFSEHSLLEKRLYKSGGTYQGETISLFQRVSKFFASSLGSPAERSPAEKRKRFFFCKARFLIFSFGLNSRKLKRRTFKECPPVFQNDKNNKIMNQQQGANNNANNNDQALGAEKTCINEKCKRTKGNHANKNSKEIRWRKSKGETKN